MFENETTDKIKDSVKRMKSRFDERPEHYLVSAAGALYMIAKASDLFASARSRNAYARNLNRRNKSKN